MLVDDIMSRRTVTINPEATVEKAFAVMKEHDIRHLPVVSDGCLVGLVTDRDVRGAIVPSMIEALTVRDLMNSDPIVTKPGTLLEDAARLVYRHKIGCLPIVDDHREVVGIVTTADMLRALIEVIGFISGSSRMDVVMPDTPEALEEAVRIIQMHGGRILGVSVNTLKGDKATHLFRLKKTDLSPIVSDMARAGFSVVSSLS